MSVKERRTKLANELMAWMVTRGKLKGEYSWAVVNTFAGEKGMNNYNEAYKAWELLRISERLRVSRTNWELVDRSPIK